MGIGDQIIGTGMARGSAGRGERIAFGNGKRLIWDHNSPTIFRNNPNIAHPGQEYAKNVRWIDFYKGHRIYNRASNGHWIWNYEFKITPGEIYFDASEDVHPDDPDLILVEPNVPNKPCGPNKQWPVGHWAEIAIELTRAGFKVRQFEYGGPNHVAEKILTRTFRDAAALLKSARLAILPEGGLHHAAAAVGTPSVVIFGGFAPPGVLGYPEHVNLTGGVACGSFSRCQHCIEAMNAISINDVIDASERLLNGKI
jgi:ADP-heptose:LPS heptosyltransferase